ncbi:MAG TPA: hypothetical protein VG367_14845 [Mucilaginibacter sp.]|jgi:hypothetical protein|nr:hypothetical protein [Mucilaginibacter sp.]
MQRKHRILAPLTLAIFFVFSSQMTFAQYPGMRAVYKDMSRQWQNQQMRMQTEIQMNLMMNWKSNIGQGTAYQVTFKDSSVVDVTSFLYTDTVLHKNFLVYENKRFSRSDSAHRYQKIYSDQTLYIAVNANSNNVQPSYGVPLDSCWSFKVVSGAINVYAKYSEVYTDLNPETTIAIQAGDNGPMVKYSEASLTQMIGQDSDAAHLIEKKKYYKAVMKYNSNVAKAASNK